MKYVKRLEQALDYWEATCCFGYLQAMLAYHRTGVSFPCLTKGPLSHWQEFRKYLLSLGTKADEPRIFDPENHFVPGRNDNDDELVKIALGVELFDFPILLGNWISSSRRVYSINAELQLLLNSTSLRGVVWSDVHFPFACYAIDLAEPVSDSNGCHYDCVIVSLVGDKSKADQTWLMLKLLSTKLDNPPPLGPADRRMVMDWLQEGRVKDLNRFNDRLYQQLKTSPTQGKYRIGPTFQLCVDWIGDHLVTDSFSDLIKIVDQNLGRSSSGAYESDDQLFESAIRIVIGLCLYLKSLPSRTPYVSDWAPIVKTSIPDTNVITKESEVCTVSSVYRIAGDEEGELRNIQAQGYQVNAHFREGYWRRPAGQGQNPEAERTIWVRPTIVRRDRLSEGVLPAGSEKKFS